MRDILLATSEFTGLAFDSVLMIFLFLIIGSLTFLLFYITAKHNKKEFAQVEAETNNKGEIKSYTKGNYAKDVKTFVKLYRKAKTVKEFNELRTVVDRIMNNVDKIDMYGRSSYNGRLWAGIHDTYKACEATSHYLNMGNQALDLIRNVVHFEPSFYGKEENDDILGVTRIVRNEVHYASQSYYKYNRIPKQMKTSRINRANAKINYDIKLKRYGTRKSLQQIKNIIEGK
jgi:hypothetical protein